MQFPESKLAHRYLDGLKGIEIGGSLHNHFNIEGCLNVDYTAEMTGHKKAEIDLCGDFLPVDVVADGDNLPFDNDSFDYVINSHMIEHHPNPLLAITEWCRVLKNDGIIFFVVPRKDDNPDDVKYEYTPYEHIVADYLTRQTVETHPCLPGQGPRGHYHFWTLESFVYMLTDFFPHSIEVLETLEHDDKVGNGFTVVVRVKKKTLVIQNV